MTVECRDNRREISVAGGRQWIASHSFLWRGTFPKWHISFFALRSTPNGRDRAKNVPNMTQTGRVPIRSLTNDNVIAPPSSLVIGHTAIVLVTPRHQTLQIVCYCIDHHACYLYLSLEMRSPPPPFNVGSYPELPGV